LRFSEKSAQSPKLFQKGRLLFFEKNLQFHREFAQKTLDKHNVFGYNQRGFKLDLLKNPGRADLRGKFLSCKAEDAGGWKFYRKAAGRRFRGDLLKEDETHGPYQSD
jgi:hypothetical protein